MTDTMQTTAREVLAEISPQAWEHPADRAALRALRAVPGFDEIVKKVVGYLGERGIRLLFQANAVRVGPKQFRRVESVYTDALTALDCRERPELYVSQTPFANAGAYGMDRPFIVIDSGTLALLDDAELRVVLGHELGHVMSGHALYHTLLVLLLNVSFGVFPSLAGVALLPIQLGLREWYRKSELSCDRAGLLAAQDPRAAVRTFLKLAGGGKAEDGDVEAFLEQAREYEEPGGVADRVFKVLNTLGRSHPFHTLRAAELDRWVQSGDYEKILSGEYVRRGSETADRPMGADFAEAGAHYAQGAKAVASEVAESAKRAAQAIGRKMRGE